MNPTSSAPIRILLADGHALVRQGLRLILDAEPDLVVAAEAADGAQAVDAAAGDEIDLAILDIAMPRLTGIQAAREISRRAPDIRILVLSMYDNEQYFFESLKAGASGYVLKSVADRDLIEACRAAMRGEPFLCPGAVTGPHPRLPAPQPAGRPPAGQHPDPEEVENLVHQLPAVSHVAAVAMPDPELGERLCIHVVPRPGATVTLEEVRESMRAAGVARFTLPERLELVEQLPTTTVGKIDKKALRADVASRLEVPR